MLFVPLLIYTGLGGGLGCTPALFMSHSPTSAAVCGVWRCVCAIPSPLFFLLFLLFVKYLVTRVCDVD